MSHRFGPLLQFWTHIRLKSCQMASFARRQVRTSAEQLDMHDETLKGVIIAFAAHGSFIGYTFVWSAEAEEPQIGRM